jgi:hypothetical protein
MKCHVTRGGRLACSLLIAAIALMAPGSLVQAQQTDAKAAEAKKSDAKPAPAKSLDDQLLEDLGPDPLAEPGLAGPAEPKPAKQPAANQPKPKADNAKPDGSKPADDGLDQELLKGLTDGEDIGQPGEQNPLGRLNQEMREVESLIASSRTDRPTQQLQSKIIQDLDELIKQSQKQCQGGNCKPGGKPGQKTGDKRASKQPGKSSGAGKQAGEQPARESTDKLRNRGAVRPDMADMKEVLKGVWGQLPEHEREQMLQSYEEQFLPKYEQMIADYFRSIAEPKTPASQK